VCVRVSTANQRAADLGYRSRTLATESHQNN